MEYVGFGQPDDTVVIRGDLAGREFIAFWQRDGIVTAAMNVNVWDVVEDLKAIIERAPRSILRCSLTSTYPSQSWLVVDRGSVSDR